MDVYYGSSCGRDDDSTELPEMRPSHNTMFNAHYRQAQAFIRGLGDTVVCPYQGYTNE